MRLQVKLWGWGYPGPEGSASETAHVTGSHLCSWCRSLQSATWKSHSMAASSPQDDPGLLWPSSGNHFLLPLPCLSIAQTGPDPVLEKTTEIMHTSGWESWADPVEGHCPSEPCGSSSCVTSLGWSGQNQRVKANCGPVGSKPSTKVAFSSLKRVPCD